MDDHREPSVGERPQAGDPVGKRVAAATDRERGVEHGLQLVAAAELSVRRPELVAIDDDRGAPAPATEAFETTARPPHGRGRRPPRRRR
jgi:hypothetical protein